MPKIDTHRKSLPSKPAIKKIIIPQKIDKLSVNNAPQIVVSPTSNKVEIDSPKLTQHSVVSSVPDNVKDNLSMKASQTSTD